MNENPNIAATQNVKPADGETLLWACDQRDARTLGPGLLNDALNLRYTDGLPSTRLGVMKPMWANLNNNGAVTPLANPAGSGVYRDPNSIEWQLTAGGGGVWATAPGNLPVSVPLPAGVSVPGSAVFVQAFDKVFLFRGRYLAPLVLSDLSVGFADLVAHINLTTAYNAAVTASGQTADEIAYGPWLAVSTLTNAGNVVTVVTTLEHGYISGADVELRGISPAFWNGRYTITVIDPYTFTYVCTNNFWYLPPGSLTISGNTTVTVTVPSAYNGAQTLTVGENVTISGASKAALNGVFAVTAVLSATQFTYSITGTNANYTESAYVTVSTGGSAPAGSTIQCSNHAFYWSALGSQVTLTSLALSGTTATATTAAAHGFSVAQYVTIAGAVPTSYNGTYQILTVPSTTTFTFTVAANAGAASGIITAQTSVTFAGQTPDTNPEAWTRQYNILPNADTALFINDLLLVPTAYQPASTDNYATISGGQYVKVDYLVATNYLDYVHFSFINEFRINAGESDEIVDLFKFGANSVIVLKGKSWAILSSVSLDLSNVSLDVRSTIYGCVARGAWAMSGGNAYYLSSAGIMTIRQTDLGYMLGVDVPLSAAIPQALNSVDWTQAAAAKMATWDNKLYCSVPLTSGAWALLVYDFIASVRLGNSVWETGVMVQGWTPMDTGPFAVVSWHQLTLNGKVRLFFLDQDGCVNLMEESDRGDQVLDAASSTGLGWQEIESYALSRAYFPSVQTMNRAVDETISLMTWNPCYSVNVVVAGVGNVINVVTNQTRSNVTYDRPFNAAPWNNTNWNGDWETPYRQDYSVTFDGVSPYAVVVANVAFYPTGFYLGEGVNLMQFQEALDTRRVGWRRGKSFQIEILNTTGRIKLVGQRLSSQTNRQGMGVQT